MAMHSAEPTRRQLIARRGGRLVVLGMPLPFAIGVGLLGAAGVALAATFVFGSFSGQTGFADSTGSLSITKVAGDSSGGVDCTQAKSTGKTSFDVSPIAQRLILPDQTIVAPGKCTVVISLHNDGTVPVSPGLKNTQIPAGWSFAGDNPAAIAAGGDGNLTLTVTADSQAAAGGVAGQLTGDTSKT